MIETSGFSESPEGTVFRTPSEACTDFPELIRAEGRNGMGFDAFVCANLADSIRSFYVYRPFSATISMETGFRLTSIEAA